MCNPYDPDPFEVVDVRGHRITTEREIPGMHRSGRVSKAETNLATPVNSFLEKEKKRMMYMQLVETQMLHRIRKKQASSSDFTITHSPKTTPPLDFWHSTRER